MTTPAKPEATEDSEASAGTHGDASVGISWHWRFDVARDRAEELRVKRCPGKTRQRRPRATQAPALSVVLVATEGDAHRVEDLALLEQLLFHASIRYQSAKAWRQGTQG